MPQPFDVLARDYDRDFTDTATGRLQRNMVYQALLRAQLPPSKILEVNCGTGTDAIWLAQQGHQVLATDISEVMLAVAAHNIARAHLTHPPQLTRADAGQLLADLRLSNHDFTGTTVVFSNFGGLNCLSPEALAQFGSDAAALLPPGGTLALVMISGFCWWETFYFLAKGRWRTAFRRLSSGPVAARLDANTTVNTWYYTPSQLHRALPYFKEVHLSPIGIWLPPSYLDGLLGRFAGLLGWLERRFRWRGFAWASDHYLMVLQRENG